MTTKKATTSRRAKSPQKPRAVRADRGDMTREEIQPLAIEAKRAYAYQCSLDNVPDSMNETDWRRMEVFKLNGKSGLSALIHDDWKPVMAHFAMLAGRDERAIELLLSSGKVKDNGPVDDTHENRATIAHQIRTQLAAHIELATTIEPITDPRLAAARASIDASGKGPIREPYVLYSLIKPKLGRTAPLRSLNELESRLTVDFLDKLRSTVRSRISTREGRAIKERRGPRKKPTAPKLTLPGERGPAPF